MELAVILNIKQAKTLANAGVMVDEVVSFCPTATYFLREKHYHVIPTAEYYQSFSHARVVVLVARELDIIMKESTAQYGLSPPEAEGLHVYLFHYLCCVYHLHFALRAQGTRREHFYWVNGAKVHRGDYEEMFASLAAQPSPVIMNYVYSGYSFAHYLLTALYNRITCFLVARSKRLKVVDYGDELPKRIVQAMLKNDTKLLVIHTHRAGKNILISTRFFIKSLVRFFSAKNDGKPLYFFRSCNPTQYREHVPAFTLPEGYSPAVQKAICVAVEQFIPFIRAEVSLGKKIIRATRPHIAVSDHAKYGYILGGLEVMAGYGGKHAMINHGTHTVQTAPISKLAAKLWGEQGRIIASHTTHSLPKSPLTEELTRKIRPDGYQTCRINVYGKIENMSARDGKFIILQAGNYTDAFNHIPWCKETADEYLLAILELVEEVGKLDNALLIIKLKNKKADTHKAIVQAHIDKLGVGDKVQVDTTSKFSDLMARAHLVVCNLSGTIEEALANNIPVMLHSYRKTYFHIDGETVQASTLDGLSPAYLVKQREDIGRIITLLDTHRTDLNNPALYANVAWQVDELMTMQGFVKQLVLDART